MRGLIIRSPWIDYILAGRKTWEIRGKPTTVRERIALIKGGSGRIFGTARLTDVIGPLTLHELNKHPDKHCVPSTTLAEFVEKYNGRAFAWVMEEPQLLPEPLPYQHPSGAVIWVKMPDELLQPKGAL